MFDTHSLANRSHTRVLPGDYFALKYSVYACDEPTERSFCREGELVKVLPSGGSLLYKRTRVYTLAR